MRFQPRGVTKPGLNAKGINWDHPFARNFLIGIWANQTIGHPTVPGAVHVGGGVTPRAASSAFATAAIYSSNPEGPCFNCTAVTDFINLGPDPIPAAQVTICMIRKKTDTTNRNPGFGFGIGSASGAKLCQTDMPFSDGTTYFDFGGQSAGTTRISIAGLTYSTTVPERWIFIAGSRGMAIWRNGIKVATQGTANPGRTVDASLDLRLNRIAIGSDGDVQDINFFMAIDDQWPDDMCRAWSAEPYAHLYDATARSRAVVAAAAAGQGAAATTFPALTVAV